MQIGQALSTTWRYVRWPLAILFFLYALLVAWRVYVLTEEDKTAEAVAAIHANRLTREDVFGGLPQEPDATSNNATLVGIDANLNGIRDDVERAIYYKYQHDAKEAAPAFQYAKALQMEFTHVYNSATLVAVLWEEDRASLCILDLKKDDEIDRLVFNTDLRRKFQEDLYEKYLTSYMLPNRDGCDLDPDSLEN